MTLHHPWDTRVFPLVDIIPADPAAGAGLSYTFPNRRCQIIRVIATYDAVNLGSARHLLLSVLRGGQLLTTLPATGTQAINTTVGYNWAIVGQALDFSATLFTMSCPLESQLFVKENDNLIINVLNQEATDQLHDIRIVTKQWTTENA